MINKIYSRKCSVVFFHIFIYPYSKRAILWFLCQTKDIIVVNRGNNICVNDGHWFFRLYFTMRLFGFFYSEYAGRFYMNYSQVPTGGSETKSEAGGVFRTPFGVISGTPEGQGLGLFKRPRGENIVRYIS